ncbi:MAG: type VI secretion system protein TssA [Planctomycetales bacterium]|nr:type VI secretion system protein TssA [Planctomycetales bacterium]
MTATREEIDIEPYLSEISADEPCGEDLEYDGEFGEMERAATATAEQQFGDTIIPGEGPDWRTVRKKAVDLMKRTRDLRVAVYYAQSTLALEGILGFAKGVELVHQLIDKYWDGLHPQLDPDDDNDPTIRVNTIATLCDVDGTLELLRRSPIVASRTVGKFSYRDYLVATGELSAGLDEESPPEMSVINAAFMDVDIDDLQAMANAITESIATAKNIEDTVTDKVGVGNATSLAPLVELLSELSRVYKDQLNRRGVGGDDVDDSTEEVGTGPVDGDGVPGARISGNIASREDVVRMLDKAVEYYQRYEPSSPLPLILTRAKRLANADFLEIIRDLAPEGLSQAEAIRGAAHREEDGSSDD